MSVDRKLEREWQMREVCQRSKTKAINEICRDRGKRNKMIKIINHVTWESQNGERERLIKE